MEISRIIEEDLFFTEGSWVTRETGDLLRFLFPIYKEVITDILPYPKEWNRIEGYTFTKEYPVPGYWKIPAIAGKILTIRLTIHPSLKRGIKFHGSVSYTNRTLAINAILSLREGEKPEAIFNLVHQRLKQFLIHELSHFKDERPAVDYPSHEKVMRGDFSYFANPAEVRAEVSSMVALAQRSKMRFVDVLFTYAEDLWAETCTPEEVEKLKSLYAKEFASRYPRWVGSKSSTLPAKRRRGPNIARR